MTWTHPSEPSRPDTTPFGRLLRAWRTRRGVSQADLARSAGTTARHLSFLETGRSRPSSDMVSRLARTLQVPLRHRNALLNAAGHASIFPEREHGDAALAPFHAILDQLLVQQEPFPAYVIDGRWRLLRANRGGRWLLDAMGVDDHEGNVLLALVRSRALRGMVENFAEVAWAALVDLEHDVVATGDPDLTALLATATAALADTPRPLDARGTAVVMPRVRVGDVVVRTVTTVARFGNARDVALDELRVELVFPADDLSRAVMTRLGSGDAG